jgi:hypothetical protein
MGNHITIMRRMRNHITRLRSRITRNMKPTIPRTIPLTCPALPDGAGEATTAVEETNSSGAGEAVSVEETHTDGVVEATAVEGASRARVASQASRVRAAKEASLEGAGAVASRVNDSGGILGVESVVYICDMLRLVKIHDLDWLH